MRTDWENKSMEPGENKADEPEADEPEADEPEAEKPEPQPGIVVDAAPGQWPPPGGFMATGTTSPVNDDDSWWQAPRESWEPPPHQPAE